MNETKTEWRDCADPDELAAAVAAGVEVFRMRGGGWRLGSSLRTAGEFATVIKSGIRYQLPTSWTWRPEPPATDDGVIRHRGPADGVRRVWTCKVGGTVANLPGGSDLPMRKAVAEAFTELTGQPVEFCFSGWGDDLDESELAVVEDRAPDPEVIRSALVERLEALPAAPPPAPPWPGAVLSGLVDEDGVPTWRAQAGQVRGEQVRHATTWPWLPNTSYGEDEWVEVRAPRAVPEPETERVPWWESVGRVVRDATGREAQILRADVGDGAGPSVYAYHDQEPGAALRRLYAPVNGSGTVEVLKDGDR